MSLTLAKQLTLNHGLSRRQIDVVLAGGLIQWMRRRLGGASWPTQEYVGRLAP